MTRLTRKKGGTREGLLRRIEGLSTVEYVIILALIAIAAMTAWQEFGAELYGKVRAEKDQISVLPESGQ